MTARRKPPYPFPRGPSNRAPLAATRTASRLPTFAAIVSALAISVTSADAHAIVKTADAGDTGVEEDADVDAETDADLDATPDAAYCDPRGDMQLGGVMVPTRVHGTGCGCGSSGDDDATAALITTAALGLALSRKRR